MKARVLVTQTCNRSCEGCCNKQYDFSTIPKFNIVDAYRYEEIILTGGEPMLYYYHLLDTIRSIRREVTDFWCKIILYTAEVRDTGRALSVLMVVDGLTLTLHEQSDVEPFQDFQSRILDSYTETRSLRLNVFKGVNPGYIEPFWEVKREIEWIENCPLPQGETLFML